MSVIESISGPVHLVESPVMHILIHLFQLSTLEASLHLIFCKLKNCGNQGRRPSPFAEVYFRGTYIWGDLVHYLKWGDLNIWGDLKSLGGPWTPLPTMFWWPTMINIAVYQWIVCCLNLVCQFSLKNGWILSIFVSFHWKMAESYHFGWIWLSLAESGWVWLSLAESGWVWLSPGWVRAESGWVWMSLDESGWIRTESIIYN